MAEITRTPTNDTLFGGAVALAQPARGGAYRVNVDAILLASFAAGALEGSASSRRARSCFDLGAGVGAVGLALLHLNAVDRVSFVEVDEELAILARRNVTSNGWDDRADVIVADVGEARAIPKGVAGLVVCNPPYVVPGRGRTPAPARARARSGPLDVFVDAARRVAGRRARVCFVYPAIEMTTLLATLRSRGLEPKRLRTVHAADVRGSAKAEARKTRPARVVLVEAVAGKPGGLVIEPPLFEGS